jgi:type VI secretion system protein ImpB
MPSAESTQHKLERVRRPRVHLTYDVEIGDAIQKRELPFVVGVLADLAGRPEEPPPRLRDRKFVEIDRDNFDRVMSAMQPRLAFQVENRLQDDGSRVNVELRFSSMEDLAPDRLAMQVHPLRKLLETRERLTELVHKIDGNEKLDGVLQQVLQDTDALRRLREESGRDDANPGGP